MMRPTRRERAAEHTREDILVAAARVFARKGYAAAGVQEIAAEAGFAAASLYSYFKGKRAIWDALRDKIIAEFEALMEKPLPAGLSLEQRLELVLSEQLGWAEGRRDEFVAVMSPPPAEASDGEPSAQDCDPDLIARSADYVARICAEHPDHPALQGLTEEEAGYVMWGLSNAYFMRWIARGEAATPLSHEASKIVTLFFRGCAGLSELAKA
ncbi:MAG: TetR/AcrR family transcriptional regulator [Sandaracinaceae bacterium]|jgi:AcrR family transcriptional regulator|nr:TetR/AcrR family transcriptional regulator [Sandaracinaceae bacterium]MBP7682131.1 TetR/AcrR family transcriptional regulator [Deltaproteobacteria bacterium]MBK6812905.1 TetR/AcrR family transcriptional regulator [Sandaracinaceae bacterium]MBK7152503.1 TetR/AcrR family transcriptional regulator [Sandaracinaceae bacterium]MBK7773729.1 TetR/AcrR family transcriptional regulator [Sandaracinaceae bacterium]